MQRSTLPNSASLFSASPSPADLPFYPSMIAPGKISQDLPIDLSGYVFSDGIQIHADALKALNQITGRSPKEDGFEATARLRQISAHPIALDHILRELISSSVPRDVIRSLEDLLPDEFRQPVYLELMEFHRKFDRWPSDIERENALRNALESEGRERSGTGFNPFEQSELRIEAVRQALEEGEFAALLELSPRLSENERRNGLYSLDYRGEEENTSLARDILCAHGLTNRQQFLKQVSNHIRELFIASSHLEPRIPLLLKDGTCKEGIHLTICIAIHPRVSTATRIKALNGLIELSHSCPAVLDEIKALPVYELKKPRDFYRALHRFIYGTRTLPVAEVVFTKLLEKFRGASGLPMLDEIRIGTATLAALDKSSAESQTIHKNVSSFMVDLSGRTRAPTLANALTNHFVHTDSLFLKR